MHGGEIITEISLFKKYKKKIKFSNSLFDYMDINPCIFIYFISLNRPENQLLYGIHYVPPHPPCGPPQNGPYRLLFVLKCHHISTSCIY